jgi:hypothetical protein
MAGACLNRPRPGGARAPGVTRDLLRRKLRVPIFRIAWAAQRHRIAADVVAFTDRLTRIATMTSRAARDRAEPGDGLGRPRALANRLAELNTR